MASYGFAVLDWSNSERGKFSKWVRNHLKDQNSVTPLPTLWRERMFYGLILKPFFIVNVILISQVRT